MNRIKIADAIAYLQPIADSAIVNNYKNALETVIEAAEKQIPQKMKKEYIIGKRHLYRCQCGRAIPYLEQEFENNSVFRYCPGCGQRLQYTKTEKE